MTDRQPGVSLQKHYDMRFDSVERRLAEIAADVKTLRESKAILEGKACEIDKKAGRGLVVVALFIASFSFIVAAIGLAK